MKCTKKGKSELNILFSRPFMVMANVMFARYERSKFPKSEFRFTPCYEAPTEFSYLYSVNRSVKKTANPDSQRNSGREELNALLGFAEQAGLIYFRTDASGDLIYISPILAEIEEKDGHSFIGHSILTIFRGAEEEAASAIAQLRQGVNQVKLRNAIGFSGRKKETEFTLRPCLNHWGEWLGIEGVAFFKSDEDLEGKNQQLASRLEEAEKAKSRFLSNISHEIRTPLNGIMGMVQLLQKTSLDHGQQEFLQIIGKSGENLLQTLNQLIDLSLEPGGKLKVQEDEIHLDQLFSFMSGLFSEQAILQKTDLDFQIRGAVPMLVSDEFRIQQILKQLIANALAFSVGRQVQVSARLENSLSALYLILEVSDSGQGISREEQVRIEAILLREMHSEAYSLAGSLGLGLHTVRMICDVLHAEPGFVSAPGKGSTFWVKVPVKIHVPASGVKSPGQAENLQVIRKMSPKILLADDNAVNLKVASEILSRAGCRVVVATNGQEALERAGKEFFHLIFMDIQMPVMDGIEASRQIQKLRLDNLPAIIAMTAYVLNEDKRRFLEAGMDDFIAKPISGDQLLSRVRHWTEKSLLKNPLSETLYHQQEVADFKLDRIFDFDVLCQLKKHLGEDVLYASLAEFALELRELMAEIPAALERRDVDELHRCLHTLKGNAGTFGLKRMSELSRTLEEELSDQDFSAVISGLSQLEEVSNEFLNNYTLLTSNYEWKNKGADCRG
jgi:signal transduction histidine kinase/CheY-like chemotaxis protein/HPt (histidine-containing phosphotransfer) domain-containing protein